MTSDARERSLFGGQPIHLFRFQRGNLFWRYTTHVRPYDLVGETFDAPGGVSRGEIQDSSERAKNRLSITLPIDLDVVGNWLPFPSSQRVLVTCLAVHAGEDDPVVEWTGRVVAPKFRDTTVELVCEPTRSIARTKGASPKFQIGCPHVVYSVGIGKCNLDPAAHTYAATLTSVSGVMLVSPNFEAAPEFSLAGGALSWTRPDGEPELRTIMAHFGDTIVIDYPSDQLADGTDVAALRGCAHTWDACVALGNEPNYGGELNIPVRSPHDGNPVQ